MHGLGVRNLVKQFSQKQGKGVYCGILKYSTGEQYIYPKVYKQVAHAVHR